MFTIPNVHGDELFLSTPSARRATRRCIKHSYYIFKRFLSTPSARRATGKSQAVTEYKIISIHALREEGDYLQYSRHRENLRFLSTPSARRATS